MKAVTFNPDKDKFYIRDIPEPVPDEFDLLIKVEAAGLNPVDSKIIFWKELAENMDRNWVPGLDVSGHVVATGSKVTRFKVGDRVLYHGNMFRPYGGFAEYAIQRESTAMKHPDIESVAAAATPCAGWTAWRALVDKLKICSDDTILITGGAGGVGGFAIQIARYFKLSRIITTCSERNFEYVKALGATHAIDYTKSDVVAEVMKLTENDGVTKGLDAVGYDNDILVADSLSYEGEMVELVDLIRPEAYKNSFMLGLGFHQLSLGSGHRNGPKGEASLILAGKRFSMLVEKKVITVPVTKVISMKEIPSALTEMRNRTTQGKIVMKI